MDTPFALHRKYGFGGGHQTAWQLAGPERLSVSPLRPYAQPAQRIARTSFGSEPHASGEPSDSDR
jgi:hypothetical protein